MNSIEIHKHHFERHLVKIYGGYARFSVSKKLLNVIRLQIFTFTFGGYITYYSYHIEKKSVYHTKPRDILFEGDPKDCSFKTIPITPEEHWSEKVLWDKVIKAIKEYPKTHKI